MPTWCANAADAANRAPGSPDYTLPGRPMTERGGAIWQNARAPGAFAPGAREPLVLCRALLGVEDLRCSFELSVDEQLDQVRPGRRILSRARNFSIPKSGVESATQSQIRHGSVRRGAWTRPRAVSANVQNRNGHLLRQDIQDPYACDVLPASIRAGRCVDTERDVNLRIKGIRISVSECPCTVPSGRRLSLLPRRILWRHRTKGEHEHKCCPAVVHIVSALTKQDDYKSS